MDLSVHSEKIITSLDRWKMDEASRASDAAETREEIGALIEQTGVNKKALSFVRALHKLPQDKRDDVLRSLHPLLGVMEPVWDGQKTPDMFPEDSAVEVATELPKPSYAPDPDFADGDPEIAAEADAFAAHLAEVAAQ
jgi:hypothetical protein